MSADIPRAEEEGNGNGIGAFVLDWTTVHVLAVILLATTIICIGAGLVILDRRQRIAFSSIAFLALKKTQDFTQP